MSASAGLLATLFALGQLMHVSYDPQGNLEIFIYFNQSMATPSEIVLALPGIQESPCVDTLAFSDRIGTFYSSRGKGYMLSFVRLSSHMTPKGETIDPSQAKIDVDPLTRLIRISQLAALLGATVSPGDYLKILIGSQYVSASPGLVQVQIAGLLTYLWLSNPYIAFVPEVAFGRSNDLQAQTLIQLINLGNPALVTLSLFNASGILQKTLQLQLSRLGSRSITNSDLLSSAALATGWLRIEGARLAIAASFIINRCILASLRQQVRAGPLPQQSGDEEVCQDPTLLGSAGVPISEPTNVFALPIQPDPGRRNGFVLLNPTEDHLAQVHLALVDPDTEEVVDETDLDIPARTHVAQFVDELFPDAGMELSGLIVIGGSDVPLVGAAINADTGGIVQSSSEVVRIGSQVLLPEQPDWIETP